MGLASDQSWVEEVGNTGMLLQAGRAESTRRRRRVSTRQGWMPTQSSPSTPGSRCCLAAPAPWPADIITPVTDCGTPLSQTRCHSLQHAEQAIQVAQRRLGSRFLQKALADAAAPEDLRGRHARQAACSASSHS